eukprot:259732-Prymnesium_polylepis.1
MPGRVSDSVTVTSGHDKTARSPPTRRTAQMLPALDRTCCAPLGGADQPCDMQKDAISLKGATPEVRPPQGR